MRRLLAPIVAVLLAAAPAPGLVGGVNSYGQATMNTRLVPCYTTNDTELRSYSGTLAPGQTFEATWYFCKPSDFGPTNPEPWNQVALAAALSGRGNFDITFVWPDGTVVPFHAIPEVRNNYVEWQRCLSQGQQFDVGGQLTLRITNVGSRLARDVFVRTAMGLPTVEFLTPNCPVRSDWGF